MRYGNLGVVRNAVAKLLCSDGHRHKLYSFSDIAIALNITADVDGHCDITRRINTYLLARAFSHEPIEYDVAYKDAFDPSDDRHVLVVCQPQRVGSNRAGERDTNDGWAGCFCSFLIGQNATPSRLWVGAKPDEMSGLIGYLRKQSKSRPSIKK